MTSPRTGGLGRRFVWAGSLAGLAQAGLLALAGCGPQEFSSSEASGTIDEGVRGRPAAAKARPAPAVPIASPAPAEAAPPAPAPSPADGPAGSKLPPPTPFNPASAPSAGPVSIQDATPPAGAPVGSELPPATPDPGAEEEVKHSLPVTSHRAEMAPRRGTGGPAPETVPAPEGPPKPEMEVTDFGGDDPMKDMKMKGKMKAPRIKKGKAR